MNSVSGFIFLVAIAFAAAYDDNDYGNDDIICTNSPYYSIDGSCNNLNHPEWGLPNSIYLRLLPPNYADNVSQQAQSVCGGPLPNPRQVSYKLFPEQEVLDEDYTLLFMQFGQFMSHDFSNLVAIIPNGLCCTPDGKFLEEDSELNPYCIPIAVDPEYDPAYKVRECIPLARSTTDIDLGLNDGSYPAEQITDRTPWMDLDIVYSNDPDVVAQLRTYKYGLLRTEERLGQSFPLRSTDPEGECFLDSPDEPCYFQTDSRLNQNPELTMIHIWFYREHNRVATELYRLNPQWSDERLFQEARKIVIAEFQHISLYEWLIPYFGDDGKLKEVAFEWLILFHLDGHVHDYDPYLKPGIFQEFAHDAFRHGHTFALSRLEQMDENRYTVATKYLDNLFFKPKPLEESDEAMDLFARGVATQAQSASDEYLCPAIGHNFAKRNDTLLGADLKAIDIARSRDHGLPSYNDMREYVGLPRAYCFNDFADTIPQEAIDVLKTLYCKTDDVDLAVGAALERIGGALIGPTQKVVFLEQFLRVRRSDRYWFEHPGIFTDDQLLQIRNSSISRIICDNSKYIENMQPNAFKLIKDDENPLQACSSLPKVDLSPWKEYDVDTPRY